MPKDKVVLSLVSFAFGTGLTLFVANLTWQVDQASEVDLPSTNIVESSLPENEAPEPPTARTVRREIEVEKILTNLGYERVFVYRFEGGFLGADLFDISGESVSIGQTLPGSDESTAFGRIICLFEEDGMAKLNLQLRICEGEFEGVLTKSTRKLRVREVDDASRRKFSKGELTGFDEKTGELQDGAFKGRIPMSSPDGKRYPPGFSVFFYSDQKYLKGLKLEEAHKIVALRWLEEDESATSSN